MGDAADHATVSFAASLGTSRAESVTCNVSPRTHDPTGALLRTASAWGKPPASGQPASLALLLIVTQFTACTARDGEASTSRRRPRGWSALSHCHEPDSRQPSGL